MNQSTTQQERLESKPGAGKSPTTPGYVEIICIAAIVAAGALFGYDHYFAPKVKVFDMKGYLREQKAMLTVGEITEEQWKQGLDALEKVLREQPGRHLIILKDVVLKNGSDPEITIK